MSVVGNVLLKARRYRSMPQREAYADGFEAGVLAMVNHVRTRAPGGDPTAEAEAFGKQLAQDVREVAKA